MSGVKFNPDGSLVLVEGLIQAKYKTFAHFFLDTGASYVTLPWKLVNAIGLKVDPKRTIQITTATTVERVPQIIIPQLSILGKISRNVQAIIKDLPPGQEIDGLLGLSFLKHFKLTIDFIKGLLTLD